MNTKTKTLYADFNGSAPLNSKVKEFLLERLNTGTFSNPNSTHALGKKVMFAIEKSRRTIAKVLNTKPNQIIFNSGASEGITQVFYSLLENLDPTNKIIITTGIEHTCIVKCCEYYQNKGFKVMHIGTLKSGVIDIEELKEVVIKHHQDIALVSIMAANNETGVIQPIEQIVSVCQKFNLKVFSDTTQYIGKIGFDFAKSGLDYAVLSSHKIGAIIGSGAVLAKDTSSLSPLIKGGGQEKGLRGGTQNYIGIESIGVALEDFNNSLHLLEEVTHRREAFEKRMQEKFPMIHIIGQEAPRLSSTTMLAHPKFSGQFLQQRLEDKGIYVTTSSACSDDEKDISKVLKAMNIDPQIGQGVIRISFCCNVKEECYQFLEQELTEIFNTI